MQTIPFVTGVCTQPVAPLQVSVVQLLLSLQLAATPEPHVPEVQTSPTEQALPSLQLEPFERFVQTPTEPPRLQLWQSFAELPPQLVLQQTPSAQAPVRHMGPRAQTCPFGFFGVHVPVSQ